MNLTSLGMVTAIATITMLGACDANPSSWSKPNMTAMSPRLKTMFEKTKTVCFGRFLIDVPESVEVAWGGVDVPLGLSVLPKQGSQLSSVITERELALRSEARYPASQNLSLYFETLDGDVAGLRHIVSQQSFSSTGMLRVDSYFALGPDLIQLSARPLIERKVVAISELNSIARRLRPRLETEAPTEPGLCLNNAFLADGPKAADAEFSTEHIRVGFRLKEFPDVHLSIYTVAKDRVVESDAIEPRVDRAAQEARRNGFGALHSKINFLRKGQRQLGAIDGYEVLARLPTVEHVGEHHDMRFGSLSAVKDHLKPMFDISLTSGLKGNQRGVVPPSLTDEEAVALWDRVTSSIRVRPVGEAKSSANQAEPARQALGTLAATGRICPQTGLWRCAEEARPIQGGREQWLRQGELMPKAQMQGEPTLWQRLRGQQPTHAVATVWALVGYERAAVQPKPRASLDPSRPGPSEQGGNPNPDPADPQALPEGEDKA